MKPSVFQPSERYVRFMSRLDRLIVALVLLLALVFGAFPARNSDVWMHLSAGRLITHFDYSFGSDPFAFTTADTYWTNHAWLVDSGLYLISLPGGPEGFGGVLAVLVKALGVVALAGLMLSIRRPTQSLWAPACTTALALVTLSPGLELRPMLLSLIFLALTLLILVREGKPAAAPDIKGWPVLWTSSPRRLYALPFLFMIWVNCDGWFWLGPATLALYLLGELLQDRWAPIFSGPEAVRPEEKRALWKVLGIGLVACLVNPHHVRAFTLPLELVTGRFAALKGDPLFQSYFTGPFDGTYFTPILGMNVAGLSYFFLLALLIGSFVLNLAGWRWWRLVVAVAFAFLSMLHMRLIPFFAVVAGPIMALNLHDFIELEMGRRMEADTRWRRTAVAGRGITVQTLIVFLLLAWAGWLHAPQAQRRLGFGIVADPSLRAAAQQLHDWKQQGRLPPGEVVNLHPALADYFAWFSPGTRSFFDGRLNLMEKPLRSYVQFRSLMAATPGRQRESLDATWLEVRRQWPVNQLALYGPSAGQSEGMFDRLLQDGQQWTLLWLDGRSYLFGWNEAGSWRPLAFQPAPLAFGPDAVRAPPASPGQGPRINYLEHFFFGPPARPIDADLASAYVVYFLAAARRDRDLRMVLWQSAIPELAGTGINVAPLGAPAGDFAWRFALAHLFRLRSAEKFAKELAKPPDLGPPAAPLLAVRAARRAIAENPDDGNVYLPLADAYDQLWRLQENHWAGISLPPDRSPLHLLTDMKQKKAPQLSPWIARTLDHRQLLRQVQLVTALQTHLQGDPDSHLTEHSLYELFWKMNYYDLALEHLRAEVEILRRRLGGREPRLLEVRQQFLLGREREVEILRGAYEGSGPPQPMLAFRPYGLAGEAIQQIRQGKGILNPADVDLYLYLLLTTGRLDELATALQENPALPKLIGPRFPWYQGMLAAARGNYQDADRHFDEAQKAMPSIPKYLADLLQSLTADQALGLGRVALRPILREQGTRSAAVISGILQESAELHLVRGLLLLEQGDTAAARQHFQKSLDMTDGENPVARRYAELLGAKH